MAELEGLERYMRAIGKRKGQFAAGFERGLRKAAERLFELTQFYVPVDTGALRDSGRVVVTGRGFRTEVKIVYGDETVHYAGEVHENPPEVATHGDEFNTKHAEEIRLGLEKMRRPQECFKFVERPMRESRQELADIIRQEAVIPG